LAATVKLNSWLDVVNLMVGESGFGQNAYTSGNGPLQKRR